MLHIAVFDSLVRAFTGSSVRTAVNRGVDVVAQEERREIVAEPEVDLQPRRRGGQRPQLPHEHRRAELHGGADAQDLRKARRAQTQHTFGLGELLEHPLADVDQLLTLAREGEAPAAPFDEVSPDRRFELPDRVADGRLGDAEELRGGRVVAYARRLEEDLELAQIQTPLRWPHAWPPM